MARYTVDYGIKNPIKLTASSLKNARKLAYDLVTKNERIEAHIYRGDSVINGVDGNGEYGACVLFIQSRPKNFEGPVYEIFARDGLVKRYPVNPDGSIGRLLEEYWVD